MTRNIMVTRNNRNLNKKGATVIVNKTINKEREDIIRYKGEAVYKYNGDNSADRK